MCIFKLVVPAFIFMAIIFFVSIITQDVNRKNESKASRIRDELEIARENEELVKRLRAYDEKSN